MVSGLYSITNKKDGRIYVGSGVNIAERWRAHRKLLKGTRHTNVHLQNAWNAHGAEAFEFAVILLCGRDEVLIQEQKTLDELFATRSRCDIYNIARSATAPMTGLPVSAETRAKRSAALKGLKRSDESRDNMSAAQKGRKLSAETCIRISESKKGDKHPNWGKTISLDTRLKIANGNTGLIRSQETRQRISASKQGEKSPWFGKKIPPDVIAKRVASRIANKQRKIDHGI